MKLVLLLAFSFLFHFSFSQSLDYISIRKKNNRVVKNFYAGSLILLQTNEYAYVEGPVKAVRHDSIFVVLYDIRFVPTTYGSFVKDTLSTSVLGLHYKDIRRIYLNKHQRFYRRNGPALLMAGGGGYFVLNVLNGAFFTHSLSDKRTLQTLGVSAGVFGLGYLLHKLLHNDGFSTARQKIVYVNLQPPPKKSL